MNTIHGASTEHGRNPAHTTARTTARSALGTAVAGVVMLALLATSAVACGSDNSDKAATSKDSKASTSTTSKAADAAAGATDARPAGTYKVGRAERTYVDTSRVTAAHGGQPELPSRTLPTLVLYPAQKAGADASPIDGRWPLIVFSHGSTRAGVDYIETLSWWTSAGYVVVAPNFPLSTTGTPGGTAYDGYEAQTHDVAFVIDSVTGDDTALSKGGPTLANMVDSSRIGAGGQSFGAITTLGVVAAKCCADPRVKVATEFAGLLLPFSSGPEIAVTAAKVPILFVHGSEDPTLPYQGDRSAFTTINAPGGFLTLVGKGHDDGFFGGGSTPIDTLVSNSTLAFYDAVLKQSNPKSPSGIAQLKALVAEAGPDVATLELRGES